MAAACAGIPPRAASFCRGCLSSYRLRRLSVEPIFALGDQQVHLLAWSVVMNPSQIRLVQESFAKVAPISDQAAGSQSLRPRWKVCKFEGSGRFWREADIGNWPPSFNV